MKKIKLLSIVASTILVGNAFALDINLTKGWNAVGISSEGDYNISKVLDISKIESIIEYKGNIIESYDPSKPEYSDFSTLVNGKGYWIKAKSDTVFSIGDTPISLSVVTFNTGWNFLGIPSMNIEDISSELHKKDMKIDSVVSYKGNIIESYDPSKPEYSDFNSTISGKGYWFKISKKVGTAITLDGYNVTLYSSKSESVPSELIDTIKSSTLDELPSILDWKNITSVIFGSADRTKEYSVGGIASLDTADLKSELAGTTAPTASIYVYGVSEGSAPYALSDALVYKINDDNSSVLIGATNIDGFITAPSLTKGAKLLIKKDGMEDKIYTIEKVGTNYIFMSDNNALELPALKAPTTASSTRILDYISETFKVKGNVGYYVPSSSLALKKDLPVRRIKPTPVEGLDNSAQLESLINEKVKDGFNSKVLASFDFYLKRPKRLGGKGYAPFDEYYPTSPYITVALPGIDEAEIDNAIKGKGSNLRVLYFDGSEWKVKSETSLKLDKTINETGHIKIKKKYGRKFPISTPVLEIHDTGFYPHVIVLDKKVTFTYPIAFHVTDESNKSIAGAAVFVGDRLIGTTDSSGHVDYNMTAGYSDVSFYVKVMKTDYKSTDKTIYISSLKEGSATPIDLKLKHISTTASVEGFVYDTNETNPVYLSKVKLYFPYALANVKSDVYKDGKLGIEVSNEPNTHYKWYMKIHDESAELSGLKRISKKRWLLVKEGSSNENGNFLSYQDMKKMIIEAKDSSDPEDVKSMVSGLFDIAVIAEHDIDGDGTPDLVELAATKDKVGTDLTSDLSDDVMIDNYAKIIGTVKFNFDVNKFADLATKDSDIAPAVKVDSVWAYGSDDADDISSYDTNTTNIDEGMNGDPDSDEAEFHVKINDDYFSYSGLNEIYLQSLGKYTLNYDTAIIADLTEASTDGVKTVALVKTDSGYKWKLLDLVDDYKLYAKLYDMNASMIIGQNVWDGKEYTVYDGVIPYNRISKFISQNEIMNKLNMTLEEVAEEAGASDDVKSAIGDDANKSLISTGMTIVPMVDLHTKNSKGKDITLVEGEKLQVGSIDVKDYILKGKVEVNPPVSAPSILTDSTDRSGKFMFSKLPLEYAKLGSKDISLLTIQASKYSYYDSPIINVPAYKAGDVNNLKIKLKPKGIAVVNINVKDKDTNESIEANVTIDGQYKKVTSILDDYKEDTSLESKVGSKVIFDDIISGTRTIYVRKNDYYPAVISKSVYKDNENNLTIYLKQASLLDDVISPSLGLDSFVSDEVHGLIKLEFIGYDKKDGTLAKEDGEYISKLVVYDNGEKISPAITMNEDGKIEAIINTPKIGKNEIYAKLINPKGESSITPIIINFYPTMGSLKGVVNNFTDEDLNSKIDDGHFVEIDLYDSKLNYIQSVISNPDGSYMIPMAPIGSVYLKALQINSDYGIVEKESDFTNAVVAVGGIKKVNLKLHDSNVSTASWIPVVDYDPSTSEADLETQAEANGGKVSISGKVSKFDPRGQLILMVNHDSYHLSSEDINKEDEEKGIYNFSKELNLSKGLNKIVVKAINPNGFYDTTPILSVKYGSAVTHSINFIIMDSNGSVIPYAHIDITNDKLGIYKSADANESGELIIEGLPEDHTYSIEASAPEYISKIDHIEDLNKDENMTIKLEKETYIPDWSIDSVSFKQDLSFDVTDGVIVKDKNVNFLIEPSDDKETHEYVVTIADDSGIKVDDLNVTGNKFSYKFNRVGNYEINIVDKDRLISPYSIYVNVVDLKDVLPEPPVAPIVPTPSVGL